MASFNHNLSVPAAVAQYFPRALKVVFKKSIFEDDFVEPGMMAWFTGFELDKKAECWKLFFNFAEFKDSNEKYLREVFFHAAKTYVGPVKQLYTAKESGDWPDAYSAYFGDAVWSEKDMLTHLDDYLKVVGYDETLGL